jgi:hypothetical protein
MIAYSNLDSMATTKDMQRALTAKTQDSIQLRLERWFEKHADWEAELYEWAYKYLADNPLNSADNLMLRPTRDGIIGYFASARGAIDTDNKIQRMMGAWRAYKHKFNKKEIHIIVSKHTYQTLQKLCSNWRKSPAEIIDDLITESSNIKKYVEKEERKLFSEKNKERELRLNKRIESIDNEIKKSEISSKSKIERLQDEKTVLIDKIKKLKEVAEEILFYPQTDDLDGKETREYLEIIEKIADVS